MRWAGQAEALVHAGRFNRALDVAKTLEERKEAIGGAQRIRARKASAIALGRLGRESEAVPLLDEARELARNENDRYAEAEILQLLATCKLRARLDGAEEDFLRAVELYAPSGPEAGERRDAQELKGVWLARGAELGKIVSPERFRFSAVVSQEEAANLFSGNISGQMVRELVSCTQEPGSYGCVWDGLDCQGRRVGSGVYILRVDATGDRRTKQVLFLP